MLLLDERRAVFIVRACNIATRARYGSAIDHIYLYDYLGILPSINTDEHIDLLV
jgi:hypothetical protein